MDSAQLVVLMIVVPLAAMLFVAWGVRAKSWRFPTIHDRARFASIYALQLPPEVFTGEDPNLATVTIPIPHWWQRTYRTEDAAIADGAEGEGTK